MTPEQAEVIPIAKAESPDYPCGVCAPGEWLPASFVISEKSMTKEQMELVAEARIKAAILFRTGKPGWDRPDSPGDPWYNPDEWDDQGNYYGPPKNMMPVPVNRGAPEEAELTEEVGGELTDEAKKKARKAYMREYMKKKRELAGK